MPRKIINLNETVSKKKTILASKPKVKSRILSDAPDEHYFCLCTGQNVKNIKELADVLENAEDSVFYHHVNSERNDFANWIKDIFQEQSLADELSAVKDKGNTRIIIYRYLLNKSLNI